MSELLDNPDNMQYIHTYQVLLYGEPSQPATAEMTKPLELFQTDSQSL